MSSDYSKSRCLFWKSLGRWQLTAKRLLSCSLSQAGWAPPPILRLSTFHSCPSLLSLYFLGLGSSFQFPSSSVTSLSIFSACLLLRLQLGISPIWLRFKFEQPTSPVSSSNPHFLTSTPSWLSTFQSGPTDWFPDFDFTDFKIFKQPLLVARDCFTATGFLTFLVLKRPPSDCPVPPTFGFPNPHFRDSFILSTY